MIKNFLIFLLAFLIIIVYINREKFTNRELLETIKYDTIYTTKQSIKYKKGNDIPFYIIDSVRTEVHDTIRIINDYNRIYAYNDTILMDSNSFYIQDTITQNKIIGRKFEANIKEKAIYITKTIQPKVKNALYLGFMGEIREDKQLDGIGIGMMYKVKNKALIGFNLKNGQNVKYGFGFYLKL
jgi:hypothetical protein